MSIEQTIRRHLLAAAVPLTKAIGHVHAPWTHKQVTGLHCQEALRILKPGDALHSRIEGELTNLFIPGFWSHGALYAGDGQVVEAISQGVVRTDLVTWMTRKDYVRAMRPRFADVSECQAAAGWALSRVGITPYDFAFNPRNAALYCFELIWAAYCAACGVESPWTLREETMGVATVVGVDFDRSRKWGEMYSTRATRYEYVRGVGSLVPAEAA